ncbi:MAG: hypothetical protein KDI13_04020 [Alphaproteobacteria bacterium]|nr:hypothetical protein [Alphaproteobacteria bacterium]
MTKQTGQSEDLPQRGNLTDFVYGVDEDHKLMIEVAVKEDGKCAIFHNKPFRNDLSWLEFDLDTYELDFILDNGEIRNIGMPLTKAVSKNMQNSHQVLMVLMDDETGDAKEGHYVPLILHKK